MTTKVFVGNLAFQTTDQALAEAFQDCGKVKSGVVITRGRRSLGYGFVEFESPDSAIEAVKSKNNTQLKGRTLKVELASDNPVRAIDKPLNNNPIGNVAASERLPNASPESNNAPGGQQRQRRKRINRRRNITKPSGGDSPSDPNIKNNSAPKPPNDNPRPPLRRRKNPTNPEDRVLSKTAVFVANLPFEVKDADLLLFFKDNNPKSAHVVVTRNLRSRGYGFVDFDHEKDQQNAISTKHNLKFTKSDRVITVTPSYKTQKLTPEK